MNTIRIKSVNLSEKTGTVKHPVSSVVLDHLGVQGDAHSGTWHRQVSLLGVESIHRFEKEAGRQIRFGEFAENITTEGAHLWDFSPLDRLIGDEVELEVTQIGKECHGSSCAIFREVGNCVMPKEGIFARVIRPGILQEGDELRYEPRVFRAHIITLSDRAFRGDYEDRSGPRIQELLDASPSSSASPPETKNEKRHHESHITHHEPHITISTHLTLIPDDPDQLASLITWSVGEGYDLVFTTGGTGIGPRDVTPDVIRPMLDKEIPGIMEMIRLKYGSEKPNALLSRSVAGTIGQTLVFTLPGSVRAVNEYMEEIMKSLKHMIYMLNGLDSH